MRQQRLYEVKQKVKKEEKNLAFAVDDRTKITRGKETLSFADLKKGMHISIQYKKHGDQNVAVAIKVAATKPWPKKLRESLLNHERSKNKKHT